MLTPEVRAFYEALEALVRKEARKFNARHGVGLPYFWLGAEAERI